MGCVRGPADRGSASAGGAGVCSPGTGGRLPLLGSGGGARLLPPALVGELTLGSRLGSLTQIRHDKEGDSGTRAEAHAWAEPRRGGEDGADGAD